MDTVKLVALTVAAIVIFGLLSYGAWKLTRWWNYSMGYESQVHTTVCGMVKPEHLTDTGIAICKK